MRALSIKTILNVKKKFWEMCQNYFHPANYGRLGETGSIVELDESKFKRKGNRGRSIRAGWVLGMVERGEEGKKILISVPDRSSATLIPIIERYVSPDALAVMTDEWRAYRGLRRQGYRHYRVNHSQNFVHPQPIRVRLHYLTKKTNCKFKRFGPNIRRPMRLGQIDIHTQTVESLWSNFKRHLKRKGGITLQGIIYI